MTPFQITTIEKVGGPLTKRIELAGDGSLKSDGSACVMSRGFAETFEFLHVREFATLIGRLGPHEAITLGRLRTDLPARVEITTKRSLNGTARSTVIARTQEYIDFLPGAPALALIDYDTKGMPPDVAAKIEELGGGLWPALLSVVPNLEDVPRVLRRSTSAGLYRTDTGDPLPGSNGLHAYIAVRDGADIERFLKCFHARCWLAGLGWLMVGAGGQLLERSIVDRVVGTPERLVFEGAPVLIPPLAQDAASRAAASFDGELLDTVTACPPLTILEQVRLREMKVKQTAALGPFADKPKAVFIDKRVRDLVKQGASPASAKRAIERQFAGVLLPDLVLPFDDDELAGATVADVLADSARFEGSTLADPLEGADYGMGKAKIMRRADGSLWIHSFAHGRTTYELRHDFSAARTMLNKASRDDAAAVFVRCVLDGDLSGDEIEQLRDIASQLAGVGKRSLMSRLKQAREERDTARSDEERNQRIVNRRDPRPQVPAPAPDAEWLPQMQLLNDVLGTDRRDEPPMRDLDGYVIQVRARRVPGLHLLTTSGVNEGDTDETRLPAPDQLLLTRLDESALAEMIERHIEYVDPHVLPVHLNGNFVKHYMVRHDSVLPVATAAARLPIVLPDGSLAAGPGLDRRLEVVFRVPRQLMTMLPQRKECGFGAVANAMRFLTHEWLCDVATDYSGRCVLIACALTILERVLLPERPAYFITAGQRGGGKTTVLNMLSVAALGHRAAAAAWSPSDEERRKALFAYLGEGVAFLVWDNLQRGAAITCPSIEKALTSTSYSDRVLGVSEQRTVPAFTVQAFTGNNITPRGDMASRVLVARLTADRPDPENRAFLHPDPIGWTEANRGRILRALYTILCGNPRRSEKKPPPAPTRFKEWWNMVGSAVEYAARQHIADDAAKVRAFLADAAPHPTCPPKAISFKDIFLAGEADDEQTSSLATVLSTCLAQFDNTFQASEVATYAGRAETGAIAFRSALEQATGKSLPIISSVTVTWRLKALTEAPAELGDGVYVLRYAPNNYGGYFSVVPIKVKAA